MDNLKTNIYSERDERGYRLRLYLEETSFDSSTNASQVDYKYYIEKNSAYSFATSNNKLSLSIDDTKILDNTSKSIDMRSSNSVLLKSGTRTIEHEEDGTKTINVSASFTPSSSAYYMPFKKSLSGTFTLTDLDRSSTIESIEPFTTIIIDDENEFVEGITFTTNINDDNYTHKLAYSFDLYGQNYNGYITENATPIVGDFHNLIEISFDEGYYNDNFQVGEALFMFPYDKFALTNMLIASKPMLTPIIDITFTLETYENGEYMGSDSKVYSYNLMPLYYKPIISNLTLQREEATSNVVKLNTSGTYYNLYPKVPLMNEIEIARYKYKIDGQDESEWIDVLGVEGWQVEGNNWSYTTNIEVPTDKGASIVFYLEDTTGNVATSTNNVEKGTSIFDIGEEYVNVNAELCINDEEVPCFKEDSIEEDGSRNVTLYDSEGNKLNVAPSVEGGIVKVILPVDLANISTSYNYFHPFAYSDNVVTVEGEKLTYESKEVDYGDRIGGTVYGVTVGSGVEYVRVSYNIRVLNNHTSNLTYTTDIGLLRDGEVTVIGGTSDTLMPSTRHTTTAEVTQIPVKEGDFLFIYAYKGSKSADLDVISAWDMTNATFEVTHITGVTVINNIGGGSGSGTSNYNELENLPRINGIKVTGNKSLNEYGIQPVGDYALKNEIPNIENLETKTDATTKLSEAKTYTDTKVANLIGTAPTTLDTLQEIAVAIQENEEVVDTLNNAIGNKANKNEIPTKTSDLTNDSGYLTSIPSEYITETELASKKYLTSVPSEYVTDSELNDKGYLTEHQPIKTVNGQTLIGSGDITIEGGSSVTELTSNFNVWELESGIYYVAPNVTMTNYTMFYDSLTSLGVTTDTSMASITIQLAKAFLIVHNYNEGMGMVEFNLFMMGEAPMVISGMTMYQEGIAMGGTIIGGDFMLSNKLQNYQEKLVSGSNIKTVNGTSLLGSGDLTIEGGGGGIETLTGSTRLWNLAQGVYLIAPSTVIQYYGATGSSSFTLQGGGVLSISDGNGSYKGFQIVTAEGAEAYIYLGATSSTYGFYAKLSRVNLQNAKACTYASSQNAVGYYNATGNVSSLNTTMYLQPNEWSITISKTTIGAPSGLTGSTKVYISVKAPGFASSGLSSSLMPYIRQDMYAPSLNKHWYRIVNYSDSSNVIYPEWTEIVENASNGGSGSGSANVTPITTISSASTHSEIPSAKAVYDLFNSIINGDEVSY